MGKQFTILYTWLMTFMVLAANSWAWDKADGLKRHASSKSNTPMIVIGCVAGVIVLLVLFSWMGDNKKKKKK